MSWSTRPMPGRFWMHVNVIDDDDSCWEWLGTKTGKMRYGMFWLDGRARLAHRVSWTLHHGPVPEGMHILHTCDNGPCVRPKHLWLGTASDNAIDRERKQRGRWSR